MRQIQKINENWYFSKEAKAVPTALPADWTQLTLPHTWNGTDGQDGGNDYYRGTCYYAKNIPAEMFPEGKVHYLQFDGVNSSATVYWNGKEMVTHHGGYSTFRVKLEEILNDNLLVIAVDNSANDFVYPQNADFTFYGGIYRDVKIVSVAENHFDLDFWGAPGIKVTPIVNGANAEVTVDAYVTGTGEVWVTINDAEGNVVDEAKVSLEGNAASVTFTVENAHLWNGVKDPYLYTAKAELVVDGAVVDEVSTRFGCRSFEFDPQKGFILNGVPTPLRGVSRHQDWPEIGNALTLEHHKEDIGYILEMGANTIRLAHYQHSQDFYDLCDEAGLVLWAEIPYISQHMPNGLDNTVTQMKELIYQNYNHPAIVTWGLSNEITMGGASDPSLLKNHHVLNDLVHELDKTRKTTMAVVTMCDMDEDIVHISDIVSYNHYFDWYGGNVNMYGPWFDKFHEKYPNTAIGISEYGCEALNWHTSEPTQGDYTEEYQTYYHEELIKMISERPYLWATHVWNMYDFAADARAEGGENGMNHKGLMTFDRKYKKDAFYAYKAWLSDEPFVHICGKRYVDRVEDVTKVTVYTNQPEVELFANGESVGKQQKGKYPFFYFEVKNADETKLTAKAGNCTDESVIKKVDTFNEDYRLKEEGDVINWFEITTPAGYFSINDTLGDIMATFRGKIFLLQMVLNLSSKQKKASSGEQKKSAGSGMKINSTIIDMAKGFTVKRIVSMVSMMGIDPMSKEEILAINAKLNKIKKK
ncbi:MAG: glycoside hydrolase family 2 protein [Roseburia sp.]|nr:glycoside hydrolase family 2 protein [Roseburia sp.]